LLNCLFHLFLPAAEIGCPENAQLERKFLSETGNGGARFLAPAAAVATGFDAYADETWGAHMTFGCWIEARGTAV
jgi:hypothetical protein